MFESLVENKNVLKLMSVDVEFDSMEDVDSKNTNTDALEVPEQVKELLLDDRFWWKVDDLMSLLKPIVSGLTKLEIDDMIVHK